MTNSGYVPELFVADADDLVALQAARGLDLDGVAGILADECARDGRADEDAALPDVGLVLADDLPSRRVAAVLFDVHGGAEDHAALGVQRLGINDLRVGELRLDVADARFHQALLV